MIRGNREGLICKGDDRTDRKKVLTYIGIKAIYIGAITVDMRDDAICIRDGMKSMRDDAICNRDGTKSMRDDAVCNRDGTKSIRDGAICNRHNTKNIRDGVIYSL